MKMWSGRFTKELDSTINDFNSSISFDHVMYHEDIQGSIAHAKMLGKCGIIPQEDCDKIIEGLKGILADLDSGALQFDFTAEDIHMFVEQVLTERIGDAGKRLHTARSRNDQVALDTKIYLKVQTDLIYDEVHKLVERIYTVDLIEDNVLESQMAKAQSRDKVVNALMRLLKKKRVLVL